MTVQHPVCEPNPLKSIKGTEVYRENVVILNSMQPGIFGRFKSMQRTESAEGFLYSTSFVGLFFSSVIDGY